MPQKEYLVSLDLFSGIAGITKALEGICLPAAYCDVSVSSQETLTRLMEKQLIPHAPICPDITILDKHWLKQHGKHKANDIDILIAGFPCIGFSSVGSRKGFANPQSSLFSHILRLIDETACPLVFLENVPNILHLGMAYIVSELAEKRGFELRWTIVSARDVGAPHKRDRWFCFGIRKAVHVHPNLQHTCYKPYPWSDAGAQKEPPRLQLHMTPRQVQQLALLGNSVVPDAVRYAFFKLVMQKKAVTSLDTPQELPLQLSSNARPDRKRKASAFVNVQKYPRSGVLYRDGTLLKTPHTRPFRAIQQPTLLFDPSMYMSPKEPSHMLTSEYIDKPVKAHAWSTPRFGNTMACNYLTSRSIRDLPTQIRFEVASTKKHTSVKEWKLRHHGKMSPAFVEYLMGYPIGWTDL